MMIFSSNKLEAFGGLCTDFYLYKREWLGPVSSSSKALHQQHQAKRWRERVFTVGKSFSWKALMILCQGRMRGDLSLFCFIFFFFSSLFQRVACCCCFAPLTVKYRHLVETLTNLWRPQWKRLDNNNTQGRTFGFIERNILSIDYRLSLVVFEMPLTPKRCWVCVCMSACNGTLRQPTLLQREVVHPGMMDEVTARARHRECL